MNLLLSGAWPLFFCLTGAVISFIPSLCSANILGTPVMSAGFYAKTPRLVFNTLHTAFFPSIDRLPPIIMVCSGHSGLISTFTFSTGSRVGTSAWRTIWISSDLALSIMIVATPALVRNFIIPCAVDGTAPSARIPGLPRIPLYFSFGRHLVELHVTWDHLEKKRTRLQTNTKTFEDLCSQSLETASQAIHDAVTTHQVTTSHISRRRQPVPTQPQI
ncbi:hypothetical protein Tco_0716888 [Tanacetum coccineum]